MAWKDAVLNRAEQHSMKRNVLLREAAAAFNRRGYHSTSLDDIAANLGVTKAALYYYFPNKQTLLAACFAHVMDAGFRSLKRARSEGNTGREKLHLALRYYLRETIDELSCCVVLTEEHALAPDDLVAHVRERDRFEKAMRSLVREGIADGSIAPCDPKLVMFTLFGAINWVPKWFSQSGEWSSAQLATAMTEILDRAISSQPSVSLTPSVKSLRPLAD
jgi:TetR/AcrR family transcriptional regulator